MIEFSEWIKFNEKDVYLLNLVCDNFFSHFYNFIGREFIMFVAPVASKKPLCQKVLLFISYSLIQNLKEICHPQANLKLQLHLSKYIKATIF